MSKRETMTGSIREGSSVANPDPQASGMTTLRRREPHGARLHVEDLEVGQLWRSPSRIISANDVEQFGDLTGDQDPLHRPPDPSASGLVDDAVARSPFGRPVVHGLLGLGILAGLSTEHPNVATLAFVGIADWQFDSPIDFGEEVYVETSVESIQPHGRRAGRVVWNRRLLSTAGRKLQHGQFITLVAMRGTNPRRPR